MAADAAWSTPAIIAEAISIGPELLLVAAVVLLAVAAATVAYVVGGYVAIHRVAAGSRGTGEVVVAALAVLVGLYLTAVSLVDRNWAGAIALPAIHVVAAWRGRRKAGRIGPEAAPPPPPPPPPRA